MDWIIYYRESKGRFTYTNEKYHQGQHFYPGDIVAKSFHGTEEEAKAETARIEREAGITGPFSNHYSYIK